jgi:hypothetical protein
LIAQGLLEFLPELAPFGGARKLMAGKTSSDARLKMLLHRDKLRNRVTVEIARFEKLIRKFGNGRWVLMAAA